MEDNNAQFPQQAKLRRADPAGIKQYIIDPSCEHLPHVWHAFKHPPTRALWQKELLLRDGNRCALCNQYLDLGPDQSDSNPWRPTFDHIVPRSREGTNNQDNLQLTHSRCNARKGNKDNMTPQRLAGVMRDIPKVLRLDNQSRSNGRGLWCTE